MICYVTAETPELPQTLRKDIKASCSAEDAEILLDYPSLYLHIWKGRQQWHVYVGETYDIVRRTAAHYRLSQKPEDTWQVELMEAMGLAEEADRPVLYVFGSQEFSRSVTLDLEHTLYTLLKHAGVSSGIVLRNGRNNPQGRYSNCNRRNSYLEKIWGVLREAMPGALPPFSELPASAAEILEEAEPVPGEGLTVVPVQMKEAFPDPAVIPETLRAHITQTTGSGAVTVLECPVIYMHLWEDTEVRGQYHVYVGETGDLIERTREHLTAGDSDSEPQNLWKTDWRKALGRKDRLNVMFVFGHPAFNKSLTLDLENRLINYCICLERCSNGRTNEQRKYHNREKLQSIFDEIVENLCKLVPTLFRPVKELQKNSMFLASPISKLTAGQQQAKTMLLEKMEDVFHDPQRPNLLLMAQGGAGTGKTVLAANLFFHLYEQGRNCHFIVNNDELLLLYQKMADAWKLTSASREQVIWKAEEYINHFRKQNGPVPDVIIVDEAHLLYTQGYFGKGALKAQLPQLQQLARVTLLMFDSRQFIKPGQYWERGPLEQLKAEACCVDLTEQLRMVCAEETMEWILGLTQEQAILPIPESSSALAPDHFIDSKGYEIRLFDSPAGMQQELAQRRKEHHPLSCMLATYDWPFDKKNPLTPTVHIPEKDGKDWFAWWHNTGDTAGMCRRIWTETRSVETDVGAVHDIQGFDLEYAGVVLGPSVKYENGRIAFHPEFHQERTKNRTLSDGSVQDVSGELLSNELFVLLTRATKGLYLFACDPALREALKAAFQGRLREN